MLISLLTSRFTPYIAAILVVVSAFTYVYYQGREDLKQEIKINTLEEGIELRKRIDEAIINSPNTPDGAREWLLNRTNR